LATAIRVMAIVAAARDADILPAVCRVHRGADVATLGGTLLAAEALSSLPTDESDMYSSMHYCGVIYTSAAVQILRLRSSSLCNGAGH
jgi:hypothetical protein